MKGVLIGQEIGSAYGSFELAGDPFRVCPTGTYSFLLALAWASAVAQAGLFYAATTAGSSRDSPLSVAVLYYE